MLGLKGHPLAGTELHAILVYQLIDFVTAGIMVVTVGLSTLCIPLTQQLLLQAIDIVTVATVWSLSLSHVITLDHRCYDSVFRVG